MSKEQALHYQSILEDNRALIWRICCGYLRDEALRQDLFQEISVNLWKNLSSFRGEAALSTWIYRVAVNTALLYSKKEQKEQKLFTEIDGYKELKAETPTAEEKEAQLELLYRCIHSLPKVDRLLITFVLEEVSYKEIAGTLGMTVSNVGVRINRIKKKLTKMMEVYDGHS